MTGIRAVRSALARVISVIRLRPFDVGTVQGRSRERYRRVALSGVATGLARGLGALTLVVSVPVMLAHLGQERYGLWAMLSSVLSLLTFADLGLGSGLVNAVAGDHARGDRAKAAVYVSSTFFILCAVGLAIIAALGLMFERVSWPRVFNVASQLAMGEAGPATAVLVLCVAMNVPLGLAQRIHAGYQESYVASLWQAAGCLLGLVGVLVAARAGAGLPWFVLALAGSPVVAALANSSWLFGYHRPELRPRLSQVDRYVCRDLLRTAGVFVLLQASAAITFQSPTLIIAHRLGAEDVPRYAIPMMLFQLSPWILSLVLTPLWPAYADAAARGDWQWVRKSFRRSLVLAFAVNLTAVALLVAFGSALVGLWAGPEVRPNGSLLLAMGMWTMVNSVSGPLAMLLNGLSAFRFQAVCGLAMAVTSVVGGVLLTPYIGIAGVVVSVAMAQVVCIHVPCTLFVRRRWGSVTAA